jgi:hypothetical protein
MVVAVAGFSQSPFYGGAVNPALAARSFHESTRQYAGQKAVSSRGDCALARGGTFARASGASCPKWSSCHHALSLRPEIRLGQNQKPLVGVMSFC